MTEEEGLAPGQAGEAGPTEAAGETTAADTVSGPPDTRPGGTGTIVEVGGPRAGGEESEEA